MARASRFLAIALFVVVLLVLGGARAQATPYDWAGPVSGNYSDPTRWTPTGVPGPGDVANILLDGTYIVTLDIDAQVDNIHVGAATSGVVTFKVPVGRTLTLLAPGSFLRTNALLDNGGAVNFAGDFGILGDAGALPSIANAGIVSKTLGSGGCQVPSVNFNSTGVLQIVSGSLLLTGGGSFSGAVDIAPGGQIELQAGNYAMGATTFPSQGTLRVGAGATVNVGTPVILDHFVMDPGSTIDGQGPGSLEFSTYFGWAGGVVANASLKIDPTASLDVLGDVTLANASLQNLGVINDQRGGNSFFTVNAASLVNLATYNFYGDGPSNVIIGSGAGASIQNEGDWNVSGTGDLVISGVPFRNKANLFVNSATLAFGPGGGLIQTAGNTFMLGGGLGNPVSGNRGDTAILGGALEGTGEIYGTLTNGGRLTPGFLGGPGSLLVDFDYVQTPSGTLTADVDTAGASDQLVVLGKASLAGTLKAAIIGSTPQPGDRFPVVTFQGPRTGTVGIGGGTGLCLEYTGLDLDLVKRATSCAFNGGVAHDSRQLRDLAALPDGSARSDHYLISQQPHSSYEVIVDATSADISAGSGPALDLVGSDGLTVVKASLLAGAKASRSLRFENPAASPVAEQYVRVQSNGCSTDCGPDDVYRIRSYDTTYRVARFNNSSSQITVLALNNPGDDTVAGNIWFWDPTGALATSRAFSIPPRGSFVFNTTQVAAGQGGSITISHDGRYAALSGKAVSVEPATGFTFDTALVPRPSSTKMVPRDN
jgi:hypothetical protein